MVPSPRLRSNTASPWRLETCQISSRRAYHSSILSVAGRLIIRSPKQRIWRAHPALDRCAPCSPLGTQGSTLALRVAAIRAAARLPVAADAHWVRFVKQRGILSSEPKCNTCGSRIALWGHQEKFFAANCTAGSRIGRHRCARARGARRRSVWRDKASLERTGKPIGANDLLIAAQALTLGHAVVTDNEREFLRIDDLRVENWLR
jgi:hypothetical protein